MPGRRNQGCRGCRFCHVQKQNLFLQKTLHYSVHPQIFRPSAGPVIQLVQVSCISENKKDVLKCSIKYMIQLSQTETFKKSLSQVRGRSQTTFTRFGFFDNLPPSVYIFYGINVYKKLIFLTTYPPTLVNVVCERPLKS